LGWAVSLWSRRSAAVTARSGARDWLIQVLAALESAITVVLALALLFSFTP